MSNAQQGEQELDDDLNDELEIEIVDDVEDDDKPRVSEKGLHWSRNPRG
jgi:hypothetical protein